MYVTPCSLVDVNLSEELSAFLFSYAMKITAEYGFEALVPVYQTSRSQSCKAVMSVFTRVTLSDLIHNHIDQSNFTLPQNGEHCCFTFGRFLICISPQIFCPQVCRGIPQAVQTTPHFRHSCFPSHRFIIRYHTTFNAEHAGEATDWWLAD